MSNQLLLQEVDGVQIQHLQQPMIKLIAQMHGELPLVMQETGTLGTQEVHGVLQLQTIILVASKIVVLLEEVEEVEPALNVEKMVTCLENVHKMLEVAVQEDQEYASNVVMQIIWQENAQHQMKNI